MEQDERVDSRASQTGPAAGNTGGYADAGDFAASQSYGAGGTGTNASTTTAQGATAVGGSAAGAGIADRARDIADSAQGKLADVGSAVREKTGSAKDSLADVLESGADKLRQRGQRRQLAGAAGSAGVSIDGDNSLTQVADKVATGMQATAGWLRDADLESFKGGVEHQVKEHPGRTLLIAAAIGYVLGKAFRK